MSKQYELLIKGKFYRGDAYQSRKLSAAGGENLLQVLKKNGLYEQDCSGRGICGKCRIRFRSEAPLPTTAERQCFEPEELRQGYRLACRHGVDRDMKLELVNEPAVIPDIIVMNGSTSSEADDIAEGGKNQSTVTYAAVDLGTTTIAMQAVCGGEILAVYTALNPQRIYGADVITRVSEGMHGKLHELSVLVRDCLAKGYSILQENSGKKLEYAVIAGNTTMIHLLRERSVEHLAAYPFSPVDINAYKIWIAGIPAYTIPGISAFVGGDIVAGILETGLHKKNDLQMLIDLGTNGEMVLGNADRLIATATSAGPAFEGAVSAQIMGSDLIRMTAQLLEEGIVDGTGALADAYFINGMSIEGVSLVQADIRALQKAKAAIAAGISCMLEQYGTALSDITRVWLSGGFGYYLDPASAVRIGLLPAELENKIIAAGNTSLSGAVRIGALLAGIIDDHRNREEQGAAIPVLLQELTRFTEHTVVLNLAEQSDFEQKYILHLNFPA